jgi:hypothetical protein
MVLLPTPPFAEATAIIFFYGHIFSIYSHIIHFIYEREY